MKKIALFAAAVLGLAIFLYASLSALVNQGLNLPGAVVVFLLVVMGGAGLLWAVRK